MLEAARDGCRDDDRTAFVAMLSNPFNLFPRAAPCCADRRSPERSELEPPCPASYQTLPGARAPFPVLLPWANDLATDEIARHPNRRALSPKLVDWVSGRTVTPERGRPALVLDPFMCHLTVFWPYLCTVARVRPLGQTLCQGACWLCTACQS